LGLHSEQER